MPGSRPGMTNNIAPVANEDRLPWWHPAALVATGFGIGLLPVMPGTWGSLAALPCAWAIRFYGSVWCLLASAVAVFLLGCWASARVAAAAGRDDPGFIVIDEIAAQWLVLIAAPLSPSWYAAAFLLFRLFDIVKPWPIKRIEQAAAGGLGIMLDDIMAAFYALALLVIGEGVVGVRS